MKFFILGLIFSVSSSASEHAAFSFGKTIIAFEKVDGFFVNRDCADKKCLAYKQAQKFKERSPSAQDLIGGKNPAAVKCKILMDGIIYIGKNKNGHEQSFCVFKDDSYLKN